MCISYLEEMSWLTIVWPVKSAKVQSCDNENISKGVVLLSMRNRKCYSILN